MLLRKTNSDNPDFQILAGELEMDLSIRDGDNQIQLAELNKIDFIQHVLIAYLQNEPIGCGAFRNYNEDTVEIKRMFVRPEFRVRGVASAILSELEKWCTEIGHRICVLETGKNQPEAIAFYKKHGFEIIPNFGRYIGSENSVCFKKELPDRLDPAF